jgi:hypothetical protein
MRIGVLHVAPTRGAARARLRGLAAPPALFWHGKENLCPQIASPHDADYRMSRPMFLAGLFLGLLIGAPLGFVLFGFVDRTNGRGMIAEVVKYLRDLALKCTRLARGCPHSPTSHGLEEVAADLMAKAEELERLGLE